MGEGFKSPIMAQSEGFPVDEPISGADPATRDIILGGIFA